MSSHEHVTVFYVYNTCSKYKVMCTVTIYVLGYTKSYRNQIIYTKGRSSSGGGGVKDNLSLCSSVVLPTEHKSPTMPMFYLMTVNIISRIGISMKFPQIFKLHLTF
jgi:hypothetical protein